MRGISAKRRSVLYQQESQAAPSVVCSDMIRIAARVPSPLFSCSHVHVPGVLRWVSHSASRELSKSTQSASQRLKVLPYPYLRPCIDMASIIDGKGIAK